MKQFSDIRSFQKHFFENVNDDMIGFLYKRSRIGSQAAKSDDLLEKKDQLRTKLTKGKFRVLLGELECSNLDCFKEHAKDLVKAEKRSYLREHINEFVDEFGILPVVLHIISASTDEFTDKIVFDLLRQNPDAYIQALRELNAPPVPETESQDAEKSPSEHNNSSSVGEANSTIEESANSYRLTQAINIIAAAIENSDADPCSIKGELERLISIAEKKIEQKNELKVYITEIGNIINAINGVEFDGVRSYFLMPPVVSASEKYLRTFDIEALKKKKDSIQCLYRLYLECRDILPVIQQKFDRDKSLRLLELQSDITEIMAEAEESAAAAKIDDTDKVDENDSSDGDEGIVIDTEPKPIQNDNLKTEQDIKPEKEHLKDTIEEEGEITRDTESSKDNVNIIDTGAIGNISEPESEGSISEEEHKTAEESAENPGNDGNMVSSGIGSETAAVIPDLLRIDNAQAYEKSIFKCLFDRKLNSAYWLTKEAENKGICINSIPSWMIKLCIVALYAENYGTEERDFLDEAYKSHTDPSSEITDVNGITREQISLFISVLSMRTSLLAPECGTVGWLGRYLEGLGKNGEEYYDVFKSVLEFTNTGAQYCAISDDDASGWEERAAAQANKVIRFVDDIKFKRMNFGPANHFVKIIFDPQHAIGKAYLLVAGNEYSKRKQVESTIDDYLSSVKAIQDLIVRTVSEVQSSIYGFNNAKPIEGKALNLLTSRMQEFTDICEVWLSITDEGMAFLESTAYNWNFEKTREFNNRISAIWKSSMQKMPQDKYQVKEGLSGEQVIRYICRLFTDEMIKSHFNAVKTGLDVKITSQTDLSPYWKRNLRYPLLFVKFPEIDEDGNYDSALGLSEECDFLKAYLEGFSLEHALTMHMDSYNFALANLCAEVIADENNEASEINERISVREAEAKVEILQHVKEIEQKIIQASIDHIISEDEHSKLEGQLLSVRKEVLPDSRQGARIYLCLKNLESIKVRLSELQKKRQDSLKLNFEKVDSQIDDESETLDKNSADTLRKYLKLGRESLDKGQIGLADQYLDFVESCLKNGEISEYDPKGSEHENYVKDFINVFNDLYKFLEDEHNPLSQINQIIQSQSSKASSVPIARVLRNLQFVPGARLNEIKNGMEAWQRLKGAGKISGDRAFADPIANIFMYMGFQIMPNDVRFVKMDPSGSTHCRLRMKDGGLSPLAEFGSARNDTYEVVFIYNRPNSQSIYQSLENMSLHTGSPIIVYFGRLTARQRDEWSEVCRQHKLTALLVDEMLMYYLTSVRENRLAAAISCGVSLSSIMPYISFGMIPRELFKGRKGMITALGKPEGSCIVYGGRQLGKSVMLHMVRQEYNRPGNGVYVFYEDIKTLGEAGGIHSKSDIWRIMLDKMISEGFLEPSCSTLLMTKDISAAIIRKMKDNPSNRVIMLLDEADNFMDADSKENFPEIVMMRKIMDETDRRFKVVLCGLHSVLKYSSVPNHPFAQMMANPTVVTPLDPKAAQELIIDPMTAIGFDFSSEESRKAVFKILSYTNYHPALIQQFCTEIIREVRREKKRLPVSLTVANVESVYKKEGIKEFIKERFAWTLNLDTRYAVIVYSMVDEQLYDYDGYRREFTTKEIQQLAGYNWPEGFKDISYDSLVSILDELVRLGVLVKLESNGTYRLRNANIVRNLGTEDEIIQRLVEIRDKASPVSDDIDKIRLNVGEGKASILNARQTGDLINPSRPGICMVFGSEALGVDEFRNVIRYIESYDKSRVCEDMTSKIKTKEGFSKALNQIRSKWKTGCKQIIAYCYVSKAKIQEGMLYSTLSWLPEYVRESGGSFVNLRVVLIFDSDATYRWLVEKHTENNKNAGFEEKADSLIFLKKWDYKALHKYLTDMNIVCSEENAQSAIGITGGWPCFVSNLIEKACHVSANEPPDIKRIIADMSEIIESKLLKDSREFIHKCGLYNSTKAENLLRCIKQFEPINVQDIVGFSDDNDELSLKDISVQERKTLLDFMYRLSLIKGDTDNISSDLQFEAVLNN